MKGRCTWNKFLNRTTQHWGRSDQFACDTFCSSCEKTRHTGDFPRFHFETVHKLFSITVIPLFFHRPLIVVNVMTPLKLNLSTYYVRQNPFNSAYFSSPPLPSWVVKGKVPVFRLISDCLVCSASSVRPKYQLWLGNLEARNSSKNDKRKVSKDIDCSILNAKDVNFCWMCYISKLNPILPLDAKCVREYWLR